jgi:MFS family permease
LLIFAAVNLVVCLPLNWLGLSRREAATETATAKAPERAQDGPALEGRLRTVGIALFALIMSLNGFVFGVVSLQLVPLLESAGLAGAAAVWVASLKGHGQFGGRLVEIFFGKNLRAMTIARIAIGVLPPAMLLLMLARGEFLLLVTFTLLLGASQGVITIVRGAVPLALFGTQGYGAVLGLIATPILLVNAFSPALFALIVDHVGWHNALYALLACSILTWFAIELMSRWYEGARAGKTAPTA